MAVVMTGPTISAARQHLPTKVTAKMELESTQGEYGSL